MVKFGRRLLSQRRYSNTSGCGLVPENISRFRDETYLSICVITYLTIVVKFNFSLSDSVTLNHCFLKHP